MSLFILLVFLFVSKTEAAYSFFQDDTTLPTALERHVVSFLDGESLFTLLKVNRYCRNLLLDDKLWEIAACKELGLSSLPKDYNNARNFLIGCYTYTFQNICSINPSCVSLLLADDGTTLALPHWEQQQAPQTIIRKPKYDILLANCYANAISPDGSVIAGWSPDYREREKCIAFRWTSSKGIEFLPTKPHKRSIALKIEPSKTNPGNFVISGTFCDDTRNYATFYWENDEVQIVEPAVSPFNSRWKTQSEDRLISISAMSKGWKFWSDHAVRRNASNNAEEYVEDILKYHNVLAECHLENVVATSANGTIVAGTSEENGKKRLWLVQFQDHTVKSFHYAKLFFKKCNLP